MEIKLCTSTKIDFIKKRLLSYFVYDILTWLTTENITQNTTLACSIKRELLANVNIIFNIHSNQLFRQ